MPSEKPILSSRIRPINDAPVNPNGRFVVYWMVAARRLRWNFALQHEGWWGVSASTEAFLDELVIWRELACNGCEWTPEYEKYASLPDWAQRTLAAHASDRRPHRYSFATGPSSRSSGPCGR
jgi:hypothetical protein